MITQSSDRTLRDEFLAVVLADPELLDLAFAEVIAAWEARATPATGSHPGGHGGGATSPVEGVAGGPKPPALACLASGHPPTPGGPIASGAVRSGLYLIEINAKPGLSSLPTTKGVVTSYTNRI